MTDLGSHFIVLAAQVTVPILAGLLLSFRRSPSTASSSLLAALIGVLMLTSLAFAPWPTLTRELPQQHPLEEQVLRDIPILEPSAQSGGINLFDLLAVPAMSEGSSNASDGWATGEILLFAIVIVTAFGLIRFVALLVAVRQTINRSQSIEDPFARKLLAELEVNLGSKRRIELRESLAIGSAATIGWLRPIILLSKNWRSWTNAELRVVLAHEVMHVVRGDYITRLLGRFSIALHGYHPLLRWLIARLELQQELAADSAAALCCGGRDHYLKTLAAIALKADDSTFGPVPTFLSRPRTLFRRIRMLCVKDDSRKQNRHWTIWLSVASLSLAALGLHGTTPQALGRPFEQTKPNEAKRTALDVGYLAAPTGDQIGVYAFRVHDLMKIKGLELLLPLQQQALEMVFGEKKCSFGVLDVEQIAGHVSFVHDPEKPAPKSSIMLSLSSVRMREDFNWAKQLQEWCTEWQEYSLGEAKYYSGKPTIAILGPSVTTWFYQPDSRTLVMEKEAFIKELIESKGKARTVAKEWRAHENSLIGFYFSRSCDKIAKQIRASLDDPRPETEKRFVKGVADVLALTDRAMIGIDMGEQIEINIELRSGSQDRSRSLLQEIEGDFSKRVVDLLADSGAPRFFKILKDQHCQVRTAQGVDFAASVDYCVQVNLTMKNNLKEIVNLLMPIK